MTRIVATPFAVLRADSTKRSTRVAIVAGLMLGLAACASPEQKVERYTESGQSYLAEEDYGKAKIQFQNALKINEEHVPALRGLITIAEKRADFRTMFGLLQRVVRISPQDVRTRIDLSKFYLLSGDETEALSNVDQALAVEPENAEAIGVKAAILFRLQDREQALTLARKALEIDPAAQEAVTVLATDMVEREVFDEALALLDRSIEASPKSAVVHLLRVQILTRQERNEDADAAYRRLIAEFPEEPGYRRLYATNLIRAEELEKARTELLAVKELLPDEIDAYIDVIRLDNRLGGKDRALASFDAFIKERPAFYELQFAKAVFFRQNEGDAQARQIYSDLATLRGEDNRSTVLRAKNQLAAMDLAAGDRASAEKIVTEILDEDERNSEALLKRASLKLLDDQPDSAIADLRLVLADEPDMVQAKVLTAAAYEKLQDFSAAERELSEAFEADPGDAEIAKVFARFLLRQDKVDRAERVLSDSTAQNPNAEENLRLLAAIKLERQDWRGAEEVARLIEITDNGDDVVNRILGAAYAGLKDYSGAIDVLSAENEKSPLSSRPLATLVNAYLETGRQSEAEAVLVRTIEGDPKNYDARLLLVRVLTDLNRHGEARQTLEAAIDAAPDRAEAYEILYRAYRRAGQNDEAVALLDAGLGRAPDSDGLKVLRADLHIADGEFDEALRIYEDILSRRPRDLIVANNFAAILSDATDDPVRLNRAVEVAEVLKDSENANFVDTYGWAKYRAGDTQEAIAALRRALEAEPDLIDARYHLGVALFETGKTEEATAHLERILRTDDASPAYKSRARELLGR